MKDFTRAGKTPYRIIKGEEDDFKQEGKIHISSTGKGYRSKSELMIDEQLRKYNVLFDYECKLFCGGKTYRPDFVITRNDGSTVIWEHFGLVGDPEYIEKMLAKYSDYIHSGIAPWDNLIMTFDHKDGGLDMEEVDFIINSRIIR
ncbi:MAG: hypothetical protein MJ146_04335 [Clostridia bacterium]|nr:hypothetical protein [Clostridia bacterium]